MVQPTHVDEHGAARMVDVTDKAITTRKAVAEGRISLSADALQAVREQAVKKGDVLATARLAGIQAAKRASDLIPLCHPIPITGVDVQITVSDDPREVIVRGSVTASWRTGVEMEALTVVSAALLTVYDMLKAIDRGMVIGGVRLLEKSGGRSGDWTVTP